MPAVKLQTCNWSKLKDSIGTRGVNLSRSCTTPRQPLPLPPLPSLKRNCRSALPPGSFPLLSSQQLLIRITGWPEMLRWIFEDKSLPSSWDPSTQINHFPSHQHLSNKFGFCCNRQPNLGSDSAWLQLICLCLTLLFVSFLFSVSSQFLLEVSWHSLSYTLTFTYEGITLSWQSPKGDIESEG